MNNLLLVVQSMAIETNVGRWNVDGHVNDIISDPTQIYCTFNENKLFVETYWMPRQKHETINEDRMESSKCAHFWFWQFSAVVVVLLIHLVRNSWHIFRCIRKIIVFYGGIGCRFSCFVVVSLVAFIFRSIQCLQGIYIFECQFHFLQHTSFYFTTNGTLVRFQIFSHTLFSRDMGNIRNIPHGYIDESKWNTTDRVIYFSFFIASLFNGNNEHNQAPQNKANLQYKNTKQFRKKNKIRKKPSQKNKPT